MTRPRGPIDSVTAAVGEAAGALRRRRESRRSYVKLYDERGHARLVTIDVSPGQELIGAAESLVDAVEVVPRRH